MKSKVVGLFVCMVIGIVVLLTLFVALGLMQVDEDTVYDFEFRDFLNPTREVLRADVNMSDLPCHSVQRGMECTYKLIINNTGNMDLNLTLKAEVGWTGMTVQVALPDFPEIAIDSKVSFVLNAKMNTTVHVIVFFPSNSLGTYWIGVLTTVEGPVQVEKGLEVRVDTDA